MLGYKGTKIWSHDFNITTIKLLTLSTLYELYILEYNSLQVCEPVLRFNVLDDICSLI